MSADYFVLQIQNLRSDLEDLLSDLVFEHGAMGLSEVLQFDQPEGEETVFTKMTERKSVAVYFAEAPPPSLLQEIETKFTGSVITVKGEVDRDWLAEWKKGFKPFRLTDGHWVVPSWCEPPPEAQHKIWIDPGMAFGTGTHETTQLVAEELVRVCNTEPLNSCLDVGTGTGILIMLARQLGVKNLVATEIEADSRRVARENFAINEAVNIRLDEKQVEQLAEPFDLVLANIIDGVLVRIQDALKARVRAGGWLIVSGIIAEREPDFLNGFVLPKGVAWSHRAQKGDWIMYSVKL